VWSFIKNEYLNTKFKKPVALINIMSVYISSLGTANPENKYDQNQLVEFMGKIHQLNHEEQRKLQVLYRASGIRSRYSVLKDFQMNGQYSLFKIKDEKAPVPGTSSRMGAYQKEAFSLALKAIDDCTTDLKKEGITHIITVSCTGFYAPGLDYEIITHFDLSHNIERYSINFMGCFAAINALKAAWNICRADADANVLILCVELCSIHLQKENTENNFLANALFGDGAAAVIVNTRKPNKPALKILDFFSAIVPGGKDDMAWHITDFGFQMRLSQYVPAVISGGINQLSRQVYQKFTREEIKNFLIHPGGKKILEVVEQHFNLSKDANEHAYAVLRNYGNMSSPTILFVINQFLKSISDENSEEKTLALAFGPGLTMESALMEVT
jgi:alpha-pyrone synthase